MNVALTLVLTIGLITGAFTLATLPTDVLLAGDHTIFIGVMTHALLGIVQDGTRNQADFWPRVNDVIFWGMNVGLVGFLIGVTTTLTIFERVFTPIMGLAPLLAVVVYATPLIRRIAPFGAMPAVCCSPRPTVPFPSRPRPATIGRGRRRSSGGRPSERRTDGTERPRRRGRGGFYMSRVRGRVGVVTAGMLAAVVILSGCSIFGPTVTTPTPTAVPITGNVCPAWTNPPAPVNIPAPSGSATTALAANNDARVLQTPRPIRSLYRIQQEVVKHLAAPIGCLARTSPRNEKVGQSSKFWVTDEQSGYKQVTARLVYVTPHLYMYLADGAPADVDGIIASAKLFERQSFPTDERTYGPHWSPGPDDDPHITVLNTGGLGNVGGYFSSEDEYPTSVFQYSNERQMIYVNLDGNSPPGTDFYNATLAHEFQHMIHWYWHPADPSWANEGMSVLAQHINHFDSGGVDQAFLQSPDTMLGGWTDDQNANVEHYGAGYLFMDYFAEHYGGYGVLKELLQDPAQTPLNFDDVLAKHGYKDTFNDVFAKFVVANLVNDPAAANGIYAYPTIQDQQVTVQDTVSTYPFTDGGAATPATVHQYAAHYYKFQGGGAGTTLNLTFAGSPYTTIVGNSPFGGAANEWWSNSGDDMDATLTHAFDLSALAGRHVALTFDAWYDLEPDFDYAYVEVSTDGGKNWTTVPTSTSTTKNPYGANIGNGMTSAAVGPAGCALTRAWTPETADLSAYAGKQVQVRFEVITDDAVHCQGLTLDNIQVPALGFKDNIASDNGWVAAGFIRSNNVLPEHWLLQAVLFPADGSAPTVRQIAVDPATGKATTAISGLAGTLDNVTVVVTAMAPSTVVPARYTLSAHVG